MQQIRDKTLQQYQILQVIGRGAHGEVYKAFNTHSGAMVALKEIRVSKEQSNSIKQQISILKSIQHQHVVQYYDAIQKQNRVYFVLELMECSLAYLVQKNIFTENLAKIYIKQVLTGLEFLHGQSIIHRDIKAANILLAKDGTVKLADFGIAVKLTEMQKDFSAAGSPYWMSPQSIASSEKTSSKCDIWSLGCTLIQLLSGKPPYHQLIPYTAIIRIIEDDHPPLPNCSKECKDFFMACFKKNTTERASVGQLMEMEWLQEKEERKKQNQFKNFSLKLPINYVEVENQINNISDKNILKLCKSKQFQIVILDPQKGNLTGRLNLFTKIIQKDAKCIAYLDQCGVISQQFERLRDKSQNQELVLSAIRFFQMLINQLQIQNSELSSTQIIQIIIMNKCLPILSKIFTKQKNLFVKSLILKNILKIVKLIEQQSQLCRLALIFQQSGSLKEMIKLDCLSDLKDLKLDILLCIIKPVLSLSLVRPYFKKYVITLIQQLLNQSLINSQNQKNIQNKLNCLKEVTNFNEYKSQLQKNGIIFIVCEILKQKNIEQNRKIIKICVQLFLSFFENQSKGIDKNRVLQFRRHSGMQSIENVFSILSKCKDPLKDKMSILIAITQNYSS